MTNTTEPTLVRQVSTGRTQNSTSTTALLAAESNATGQPVRSALAKVEPNPITTNESQIKMPTHRNHEKTASASRFDHKVNFIVGELARKTSHAEKKAYLLKEIEANMAKLAPKQFLPLIKKINILAERLAKKSSE